MYQSSISTELIFVMQLFSNDQMNRIYMNGTETNGIEILNSNNVH